MIPKQIGWSIESNLLWLIAKQVEQLNKVIAANGGGGGIISTFNQILTEGNESTTQDAIFRIDSDFFIKIDRANQELQFYADSFLITKLSSYELDFNWTSLGFTRNFNINPDFGLVWTGNDHKLSISESNITHETISTGYSMSLSFGDQTSDHIAIFQDASGTIAYLSDLPQVENDFPNDVAAATGGISVGGLYHTAGVVKIRLT